MLVHSSHVEIEQGLCVGSLALTSADLYLLSPSFSYSSFKSSLLERVALMVDMTRPGPQSGLGTLSWWTGPVLDLYLDWVHSHGGLSMSWTSIWARALCLLMDLYICRDDNTVTTAFGFQAHIVQPNKQATTFWPAAWLDVKVMTVAVDQPAPLLWQTALSAL